MSTYTRRLLIAFVSMSAGLSAFVSGRTALATGVSLGEENASMYWSFAQEGQAFGASLASGDYNGDGLADIAIGAPHTDITSSDEGTVYIVYGDGSLPSTASITSTADVTISGAVADEHISKGTNITVSSLVTCNLNADGYADLIMPAENAVYILYGRGDFASALGVTDMVKLEAGSSETPSGIACGDFDNDTHDDLAIGIAATDTLYIVPGSAEEIVSATIASLSTTTITGESGGSFASRIVVAGDVNGDGYDDIVVNDILNDSDGSDTGALYIFYGGAVILSGVSSTVGVEITGSSSGVAFGTQLAVGDINADGMAEIFVHNPLSTETLMIIPGSTTPLTNAAYSTLLTFEIADFPFANVFTGDVNGDGVNDLLLGGNDDADQNDTLYVVLGESGTLPNAQMSDALYAAYMLDDSQLDSGFGEFAGVTADMNADGHEEVYVGAHTFVDSSVSDTDGRVYGLFFSVDADADGLLASTSLLAVEADANDDDYDNDAVSSADDCNDTDSTVSSEQTYYADADSDGLGDPEVSTTICSSEAPSGYVSNNSDIAGEFDITEVDPADTDVYASLVSYVEGMEAGKIHVHFADNTSAEYTLFDTPDADTVPKVESYNGTGYLVVLHPNGKKIKLVNVYTGEVLSEVRTAKSKYTNRSLKLFDLREDGQVEAVAIMKRGKTEAHGRVVVVSVDLENQTLTKKDGDHFDNSSVRVKYSENEGDSLFLRDPEGVRLVEYAISSEYILSLQQKENTNTTP